MFRPSGGHHQVVHSEVDTYYNVHCRWYTTGMSHLKIIISLVVRKIYINKKYDPYELMQNHEPREQQTSKGIFLDDNNAPVLQLPRRPLCSTKFGRRRHRRRHAGNRDRFKRGRKRKVANRLPYTNALSHWWRYGKKQSIDSRSDMLSAGSKE